MYLQLQRVGSVALDLADALCATQYQGVPAERTTHTANVQFLQVMHVHLPRLSRRGQPGITTTRAHTQNLFIYQSEQKDGLTFGCARSEILRNNSKTHIQYIQGLFYMQ